MKKTILSLGAGRQSSLIAVMLAEKHPKFKQYWENGFEIIFADTGEEKEETYNFLYNELIPHLKNYDVDITIISRPITHDTLNLYDGYWKGYGIPTRKFRSCTDKYKIQVIRKHIRTKYGKRIKFDMLMGITIEEAHKRMRKSDVLYADNIYPLVYEYPVTAEQCTKELNEKGLYPVKSGCYMCPFETPRRFIEYVKDKPDQKKRVMDLEARAMNKNPKLHIFKRSLKHMFHIIDNQTTVDDFFDEEDDNCESGYCFV